MAIELKKPAPIGAIRFSTSGAKKIEIQGCKDSKGNDFTQLGVSKEIANKSGLQQEQIQVTEGFPVTIVKFIIQEGWEDFVSVHAIEIMWFIKFKGFKKEKGIVSDMFNLFSYKKS